MNNNTKNMGNQRSPDSSLVFSESNRLDLGRYSIIIPDGFSVKRNVDGRAFWAWLPDASNPRDRINAPILLMEGQFVPDPGGGLTPVQDRINSSMNGLWMIAKLTGMDMEEPEQFQNGDVYGFVAGMENAHYIGTIMLPDGSQQIRVQANTRKYQGKYAKNLLVEVLKTVRIKENRSGTSRGKSTYSTARSATASDYLAERKREEERKKKEQQKRDEISKEFIVSFLENNPGATCAMIAENEGLTLHATTSLLTQLINEEKVERKYEGKTPVYFAIKQYSDRERNEIKGKIQSHLDSTDQPCTVKELSKRLQVHEIVLNGLLKELDKNGKVIVINGNSNDPQYSTPTSCERVKRKKEQEEEERKERLYREAVALTKKDNSKDIEAAVATFETLNGYKDVTEQLEMSRQKLDSVLKDENRLAEEEAARISKERRIAENERKKWKNRALTAGVGLVALLVGILIFQFVVRPEMSYRKALAFMESGNYDAATAQFTELKGYRDSEDKIIEIKNLLIYKEAEKALEGSEYDTAEKLFRELGGFSDSVARVEDVIEARNAELYKQADAKLENNNLVEAQEMFAALGEYSDSEQRVEEIIELRNKNTYEEAEKALNTNNYDKAEELFKGLGQYSDSEQRVIEVIELRNQSIYKEAEKALKNHNFDKAEELFKGLGQYSDAPDRVQGVIDARNINTYNQAALQFDNGNYKQAKEFYDSLGSYSDAEEKAEEAQQKLNEQVYAKAGEEYSAGNYEEAKSLFVSLGSYSDAKDRANQAQQKINEKIYAEAGQLFASGKYKDAKEKYEKLGDYLDAKQKAELASNELKKQEEIAALQAAWNGAYLFPSSQGGAFVFEFEWTQGANRPTAYFSDSAGRHWLTVNEISEKKVVLYDARGVTDTLTKSSSGDVKWQWESSSGWRFY